MKATVAARLCPLFLLIVGSVVSVVDTHGGQSAPEAVRVMSYNLWHGGDAGKKPLDQTVAVIQKSQADIVGLQETANNLQKCFWTRLSG